MLVARCKGVKERKFLLKQQLAKLKKEEKKVEKKNRETSMEIAQLKQKFEVIFNHLADMVSSQTFWSRRLHPELWTFGWREGGRGGGMEGWREGGR